MLTDKLLFQHFRFSFLTIKISIAFMFTVMLHQFVFPFSVATQKFGIPFRFIMVDIITRLRTKERTGERRVQYKTFIHISSLNIVDLTVRRRE